MKGPYFSNDPPWSTIDEYTSFVKDEFGSDAESLLRLYAPATAERIRPVRLGWYQDGALTAARYLAAAMESVESPAYMYVFSRKPPGPGGEMLGAFHYSEAAFIFDAHFPEIWPVQPGDAELTDTMGSYWVQFALTGNPNREGLPEWPAYARETDSYLDLNHETVSRTLAPDLVERLTVIETLFWK